MIVVAILVVMIAVAFADLSADLPDRESGRVDVDVSGIRSQRIDECVEVSCGHVLPGDGLNVLGSESARHGSGVRGAQERATSLTADDPRRYTAPERRHRT